jgi:hypothetical protein
MNGRDEAVGYRRDVESRWIAIRGDNSKKKQSSSHAVITARNGGRSVGHRRVITARSKLRDLPVDNSKKQAPTPG